MKKLLFFAVLAVSAAMFSGCATQSRRIPEGATAKEISGFSQDDVDDVVSRAVQSILSQDRIHAPQGAARAILVVENVRNDTTSLGSQADILSENIGQSLREELTNSGKVVVYNKEVAKYATVQVTPQFILYGRLTQRNMRQDGGDYYKEFSLNLQLVEIATGLEFWQKRIPLRKEVDARRVMY